MKQNRRNFRGIVPFMLIAIAVSGIFIPMSFAGDVTIIANSSVGDAALSKDALKEIYTGKQSKWSDGTKIYLSAQKKNATHKTFTKKFVSKSPSQFRAYWKKMVFTGKGKSPKSFNSDADIVKYVAETSGAIGYVAAGTAVDGVKTITVN